MNKGKILVFMAIVTIAIASFGWAFTQNGKDHERIVQYMESKGYVHSEHCKHPKRFNFWNAECCEDAPAARTHKVWAFAPNKKMRCFEFVFWKKTGQMEVQRGNEYE